jgi:hypothetical protein
MNSKPKDEELVTNRSSSSWDEKKSCNKRGNVWYELPTSEMSVRQLSRKEEGRIVEVER